MNVGDEGTESSEVAETVDSEETSNVHSKKHPITEKGEKQSKIKKGEARRGFTSKSHSMYGNSI